MLILLGNFDTARMASEMGIELSDEDKNNLESMRQDDAQEITPGKFHCFDIPRTILCGDMETVYKVAGILQKYKIKGVWQVSTYGKNGGAE